MWLLEQIGLDKGLKSLERFGIPLVPEDRTYPIALGGMHVGTSPFVMAQAYSTFANDGVKWKLMQLGRYKMLKVKRLESGIRKRHE